MSRRRQSSVRVTRRQLILKMEQVGKKAVKGVSDVFQDEGERIRDLARLYAPVDEGDLESAIVKETSRTGINRRAVVSVYVDESHVAADGTPLSEYAKLMHNTVYQLGPKSLIKETYVGLGKVGTGFLKRAVEERRAAIYEKAANKVQKLL